MSGDPGSKSEHFRQELLAGLERFLTLFGRILLRLGVGYGEFTVIARRAFAAGGARSLGLESPADDPERVAALTGLTTEDIAAAMIVLRCVRPSEARAALDLQTLLTIAAALAMS